MSTSPPVGISTNKSRRHSRSETFVKLFFLDLLPVHVAGGAKEKANTVVPTKRHPGQNRTKIRWDGKPRPLFLPLPPLKKLAELA